MKHLTCIEFSVKGTVIFVAGGQLSTQTTTSEGECYASVAAVKFSSNMKVISEYKLKDSNSAAHSMKRHEQGNILFVGTSSKVEVLFFDGSAFECLAQYGDLNCGPITCMQLLNDDLYCLGAESPTLLRLCYSQPLSGAPQTQTPAVKPSKTCVAQFLPSSKKVFVQQQALQDWELTASRQLCTSEGQVFVRTSVLSEAAAEGVSAYTKLCAGAYARLMANGRVVVVDSKAVKVLDGVGACVAQMQVLSDPSTTGLIQPICWGSRVSLDKDPHVFACMIAPGVLGVFDLQKLEYDRVPISTKPEQIIFKHMLLTNDGSKVLGLCEGTNKLKEQTLYYWQKTELMAPATRSLQYFSEKLRDVQAFEATTDSSIFIMAGTLLDGKPALLAGSLDGYFDQVSQLDTLDSPALHSLKRIGNSDFFFVGGVGKLHVVLIQNRSVLVEVSTIKDLKLGAILKMELGPSASLWLLEKEGHKTAQVIFGKPLDKLTL